VISAAVSEDGVLSSIREPNRSDDLIAAHVIDCAHFSEEMGEDKLGFLTAKCSCGWECPPSPDDETRTDFLMQHAYEAGILTERSRNA
jgi:hypothetical protein